MSITFISCKIKAKGESFKEKMAETNAQISAPAGCTLGDSEYTKNARLHPLQLFNSSTLSFNALNICPLDIAVGGAKLAVYGFTTHK
jgi:hypothetical protein